MLKIPKFDFKVIPTYENFELSTYKKSNTNDDEILGGQDVVNRVPLSLKLHTVSQDHTCNSGLTKKTKFSEIKS